MENPYQYRDAIEDPENFFGRKKEINRIFNLISNAAEPHSISVEGERKIGKSSLLHFIRNEATRKKYLKNINDYVFVYLKLSAFLGYDSERFCEMLLKELSSATSEEIISSCNNVHEALDKFIGMQSSKGKRIIVILDEFDSITDIPAFDSVLLGYFRGLTNRYSLAFITSSRVPINKLTEAIDNPQTENEDSSPFFNVFFNISLRHLKKQEALELIEKPSSRLKVRFNKEDKDFINEIAFLHPFFIQLACCHLFSLRREENKVDGETIDKSTYDSLFQRFYEETIECWDFYLNHMDHAEKDALLKICEGEKIRSKRLAAIHRLNSKGLIYEKNGKWRIFSSAFAYHLSRNDC